MNGKREFYRKAYLKGCPKKGNISFPDPPPKPSESWLLIIFSALPTIAMTISIFLSISKNENEEFEVPVYMIIMSISFLVSPVISIARYFDSKKRYNKEKEYWKAEIEKVYREYEEESEKSRKLLKNSFQPQEDYEQIAETMPPFLWNTLPGDNDYAKGYIGTYTSDVFFEAHISKGVKILEPSVEKIWIEKQNSIRNVLTNTPFVYDFILNPALGICGNEVNSMQAINAFVINMAIRHGYDRMKIALISNKKNFDENYAYIKWLPHIWNSKNTRRMIALCEKDIYELENEISDYYHFPQREQHGMFLLCIVDDSSYLEKKPLLRWINEKRFGTFLFSVFRKEEKNELPSSCEHFLCLEESKNANYYDGEVISYDQDNKMEGILIHYEVLDKDTSERIARKLSSVQIMDTENNSDIPSLVYFLESENILSIEKFPINQEWKQIKSRICARIGKGTENRAVSIDFSDGINIHMIVIGTSGSGKSQFLISMVLDMMLHYSSEEVNFVFIDFKGNAFSSAFSHITDVSEERTLIYPNHVVGSISNIESDGEYQIIRIRIMLKKEISRRENLLSKATEKGLISEARIDLYQQAFKSEKMKEDFEFVPLPELFMIVDEFMELLDSYNSIISEFNMIARKGRSLGIHLVLSSQKMSGRLSPQISANANTRICFRVIDPSDSTEMIGTDDAYHIDSGMFGRSYFKSGTTLQEFQAPLSDAIYMESTVPSFGDVDDYGKIKETVIKENNGSKMTERQAVINKICNNQKSLVEKNMVVTEPLPEILDFYKKLKEINEKPSGFPIGKRDNIYSQCYDTAQIDFRHGNWLIQGISRCGKTNLLIILLLSAAYYYNSMPYHFFVCDLQSTELKKYCCLRNVSKQFIDNIERLIRLIYYLTEEINRRKILSEKQKNIVVIIDNYDYIVEKYEYILPELSALFSRGPKYGIWFVVSHNEKITGYQSRDVDFYNKIVMMQKTENDYSNIIDLRDIKTIRRVPGRGFISGDIALEMQTFTLPYNSDEEKEMIGEINKSINIKEKNKLKRIEILPESLSIRDFVRSLKAESETDSQKCYIGISSKEMKPVGIPLFEKRYFAVTCDDTQLRIDFIKTMLCLHYSETEIWKEKKILIVTKNENLKTTLHTIFGSRSAIGKLKDYVPNEPVPDFCILNLLDIKDKESAQQDFAEVDRVIGELMETERLIITENLPDFYEDLNETGHGAFFQKFINYFMDIYMNKAYGAWINCLTEADLEKRNDFLSYKIDNQTFATMISEEETKNLNLGIEQHIIERNLISIDIPYSGGSLPFNQAWLRENGKYSRVLCADSENFY